jgi:hypothetical protein
MDVDRRRLAQPNHKIDVAFFSKPSPEYKKRPPEGVAFLLFIIFLKKIIHTIQTMLQHPCRRRYTWTQQHI